MISCSRGPFCQRTISEPNCTCKFDGEGAVLVLRQLDFQVDLGGQSIEELEADDEQDEPQDAEDGGTDEGVPELCIERFEHCRDFFRWSFPYWPPN